MTTIKAVKFSDERCYPIYEAALKNLDSLPMAYASLVVNYIDIKVELERKTKMINAVTLRAVKDRDKALTKTLWQGNPSNCDLLNTGAFTSLTTILIMLDAFDGGNIKKEILEGENK